MTETAFGVAAGLLAIAMGISTLDRWLLKRRPHELIWTIALACFAIASFALAFGARHGWNSVIFRTFYTFGAIVDVPILALGVVTLHRHRRWPLAESVIVAFSFLGIGVVYASPFRHPLPMHDLVQGSKVFGVWPRILAAVGSGVGATVIIIGAFRSIFSRPPRPIVTGNLLIAIGTAVTGASGLLNSAVNAMVAFSITLAVGIGLIFLGFLFATTA